MATEREPGGGDRSGNVSALDTVVQVFGNILCLACHRHLAITITGGLAVGWLAFAASPLWVFEGMLLAQILGFLFDVDADRLIDGSFDQVDHAGFVAVLALFVQLVIATTG